MSNKKSFGTLRQACGSKLRHVRLRLALFDNDGCPSRRQDLLPTLGHARLARVEGLALVAVEERARDDPLLAHVAAEAAAAPGWSKRGVDGNVGRHWRVKR